MATRRGFLKGLCGVAAGLVLAPFAKATRREVFARYELASIICILGYSIGHSEPAFVQYYVATDGGRKSGTIDTFVELDRNKPNGGVMRHGEMVIVEVRDGKYKLAAGGFMAWKDTATHRPA